LAKACTNVIESGKRLDKETLSNVFLARAAYNYRPHPSQALADFSRAITLNNRNAIAYGMRARLLWAMGGHDDQARKDCDRAAHIDPDIQICGDATLQ